jgi:bifunctional non-homologous end joining protein LigD
MLSHFENLYKFSSGKAKLELRSTHVPSEDITPVEETEYEPARLAIQEHHADRAGKHFDVRLIIGKSNKAVSFATRKGLPTDVGSPRLLVRQPDHTAEYATWAGEIPKGEYGAGHVAVVAHVPAVARSYGNKIDLTVSKGPLKGRYSILKQSGNHWFAIRHKRPDHYWEERPKYNIGTDDMLQHPEFIAEHKIDGVHAIARLDAKKGISLAERNKSVMGEIQGKEDHVPWIRDFKVNPKYHGVVVRGELFHPDHNFATISSVLLSDPHTAIEAQKKIGKLSLAAFELVKGPYGKNVSNWSYNQKRDFLRQLVTDMAHPLVTLPESSYDKAALLKRVLRGGGEGIVLKHILTGEAHKLKKRGDLDLKIVGFESGAGRLAGRGVGAFRLADRHGNYVGNVGTGLSDIVRQDALKNPSKYLHKLVKVQFHEITDDRKLREPRWKGWTTDKQEADEVHTLAKSASGQLDVKTDDELKSTAWNMKEIPGTKNPGDGAPLDVIVLDKDKTEKLKKVDPIAKVPGKWDPKILAVKPGTSTAESKKLLDSFEYVRKALRAKEDTIKTSAASKTPPKIGDEVTVQLEKGRGYHIVAMGEIPGTKNPADGDPYDVIIADKKGGQGGRFKVVIVGKITDPTGNHKWVATTDGSKPSEQEMKSLRGYRAARSEFIGKKMKIQIPGMRDKQVKSAEVPHVRQEEPYYCGVAVVKSLVDNGEDQDELAEDLNTTERDGTDPHNILRTLKDKGISASLAKGMTVEELKSHLDAGTPVVLMIQDYGDTEDYSDDWKDGHYVIAKSYDGDTLTLEDPASDNSSRTMSLKELQERWHDIDKDGEKYVNSGIVVKKADLDEYLGRAAGQLLYRLFRK